MSSSQTGQCYYNSGIGDMVRVRTIPPTHTFYCPKLPCPSHGGTFGPGSRHTNPNSNPPHTVRAMVAPLGRANSRHSWQG
eukprot:gene26244-biopygen15242